MDGLGNTQTYAQSLNAVASNLSGGVAVDERLEAVETEIFNRKVDSIERFFTALQPHFNRARKILTNDVQDEQHDLFHCTHLHVVSLRRTHVSLLPPAEYHNVSAFLSQNNKYFP